jgi:hypothetical protein
MPRALSRHPAEPGDEHEARTVAGQLGAHARFMRKAAVRVGDEPDDRAAVEILLHAARRLTDFEGPLEDVALQMQQAAQWIELGRMLERADIAAAEAEKAQQRGKRASGSHLRPVPDSGAA